MIGQAYQEWLTPREQEALAGGCALLIDFIFDEFAMIEEGDAESIAESALGYALPSRHLSRHTSGFLRRFAVCIITVAWKLAQQTRYPPASVAEQLAAWAIIEHAKCFFDAWECDKEQQLAAEGTTTPGVFIQTHAEEDEGETRECICQ